MIPGPALRKECPYCKEVKELMSLRSGNTIGGEHWSDTKKVYPMLPKCPGCGKYYSLADAKTLPSGEDPHKRLMDRLFDLLESEDKQV